jgi:MFS family permease
MRLVVLLGVISLFADMTYEGARSITGPYLAYLGANATVVGVVAGAGELIGYGLRLASGLLSDKTERYWTLTIIGYVVNLVAVPLLALVGHWEYAAGLMIMERIGKAIRAPAKDAILSHATQEMGRGWGYGLHEAMDQTGATLGPLLVAAVLYFKGGYATGFALLGIPALLTIILVCIAPMLYPRPQDLEVKLNIPHLEPFSWRFWLYLLAIFLIAAGFADFPLIAFHFAKTHLLPAAWIPTLYSLAMVTDAIAALVLGRLFDRHGLKIILGSTFVAAGFAPLVFLGGLPGAILGMIFWGVGMGALASVVKASVAAMTPAHRRGSAFGLFNAGYGLFWFAGSAWMGYLYDHSIPAIVGFSVGVQLLALCILIWVIQNNPKPQQNSDPEQ